MSGLDYERLVLAGGPVGIMQSAFDTTLDYVKSRKQFGKPIGEFQLMQGKIAEMYSKLQSSRAMLYSLTKIVD
jgi:isovaleryl-CoA dehydrogenase